MGPAGISGTHRIEAGDAERHSRGEGGASDAGDAVSGSVTAKVVAGGAGDASEASGGVAASGVPEKTGGGGASTARDVREREENDR